MTSSIKSGAPIQSLKSRLRNARHALYELLPFVKRKRYKRCIIERDAACAAIAEQQVALQKELQPICAALLSLPGSLANNAKVEWIKPSSSLQGKTELCLFVTHAQTNDLKLHVVDHIHQLAAEGIAVVLILNTSLTRSQIQIQNDLISTLHGCVIRENIGYDFGAWSHAYSMIDVSKIDRLFLVNDSIVGPLDHQAFSNMISRVRASDADLTGLTQNPYPKWHLQSFFLVISKRLLNTKTFSDLMGNIVNLPTKEAVINTYETQISSFLMERGFQCKPVFPHLDPDSAAPDDTHARWSQLVESGFPFIKASILKKFLDHPKAIELIPAMYRKAVTATHGANPEEKRMAQT